MPNSKFLKWGCIFLFILAYIVLAGKNTALAEFILYFTVFGSVFLYLFHQNQFLCLNFFIVWLPLQTLILASMAASDLFSDQLIKFMSSLKELALLMLFLVMLKKKMIFRGKLSFVDYLFLLNVILIFVYAALPNSFFGVTGDLKVRLFGVRTALVTLTIFLVGRYIPYDAAKIRSTIRLLAVVCFLIVLFGFVELLFIPRDTLITGLIPYNVLKGENLENLQTVNFSYIVSYGGMKFKRMMSFFLSPLGLAYFVILPFAFVLSVLQQKTTTGQKFLPYPISLFGILCFAILLSNTRAVILATFLMVMIAFSKRHFYKTIVVFVLLILFLLITPLKSIFSETASLEDPSARAHALAYTLGVATIIKHPLGIGLGQAGPAAFFIKGAEGLHGKEEASIGESLYLTMAVERGLPGLGFFIFFVCYIARAGIKLSNLSGDMMEMLMGKAVFFATACFMVASIPTEHWLGFQSAGIYWWFAGLAVQRVSYYKKETFK